MVRKSLLPKDATSINTNLALRHVSVTPSRGFLHVNYRQRGKEFTEVRKDKRKGKRMERKATGVLFSNTA